jgi:hypothetical protein
MRFVSWGTILSPVVSVNRRFCKYNTKMQMLLPSYMLDLV